MNLGGHGGFLSTGLSGGADTCAKIVCLPGVVGAEVVATVIVEGAWNILEKGVVQKEPWW